ncbi:DEAD/DEAH box helicase [Gemmatimonas sp.]|uniref:DEAD/DEAH box helicase n=1 Tax=Gemmatimonas sp. TaxID=1962908 RepID=UPI003DA4FFE3
MKRDLEGERPMDRLLVGDVGYGKTEIAIRAAFKAVQSGRQVAVLVPTTILAEQHARSFGDRLADFPVAVEVMSRFQTAKEQAVIVEKLKKKQVDIIIGTHRLLSPDVEFAELGLIIVDEEHRFGVKHKERLKQLKLSTDVLTLTATPIPRTLHQSLAGLRDLTLMQTAPRDRSPVLTFVEPFDDALIEEAISRELDRGGQVFFVHNRIETITAIADHLKRVVPRARVAVGHGQMKERELEKVMRQFVEGEVDILGVHAHSSKAGSTSPMPNTMFVNRADHLGLGPAVSAALVASAGRTAGPTATCSSPTAWTRTPSAVWPCSSTTPSSAPATAWPSRTSNCVARVTCLGRSSRASCTRWASTCTCDCSTKPCASSPTAAGRSPGSRPTSLSTSRRTSRTSTSRRRKPSWTYTAD